MCVSTHTSTCRGLVKAFRCDTTCWEMSLYFQIGRTDNETTLLWSQNWYRQVEHRQPGTKETAVPETETNWCLNAPGPGVSNQERRAGVTDKGGRHMTDSRDTTSIRITKTCSYCCSAVNKVTFPNSLKMLGKVVRSKLVRQHLTSLTVHFHSCKLKLCQTMNKWMSI